MEVPERNKEKPEKKIQREIISFLRTREWVVLPTHGNMYQQGFPDLYCLHRVYGQKWVEVKRPKGYKFTAAQKQYFPMINEFGHGI